MSTWSRHRCSNFLLCLGTTLALSLGALGCSLFTSNNAAANANKKQDGEPCAKDSDCINVCLTGAEAEKAPMLRPNTCGKTDRTAPK